MIQNISYNNNRIFYLDFLRVIAMFAVIILHVASFQMALTKVGSFEWNFLNFFDSITRWCVPTFVMISGMLFLNPQKEINLKIIYGKYIFRILIILFSWNLLYAISSCIVNQSFVWHEFIYNIFIGLVHMWYLYMLIGLYIILPFLRKIVTDTKLLKYFLLLWLIISAFNFLVKASSLEILNKISDNMYITLVTGYSGYFLLGYFLSRKKYRTKYAIILGIISLLITVIGTYIVSINSRNTNELFYANLSPNVIGMSISVFILVKNTFENLKINVTFNKIINTIAKYSLGIYLIHFWFISVFIKFENIFNFSPIINLGVISCIVFLLSFTVTFILSKIKFIRHIVM